MVEARLKQVNSHFNPSMVKVTVQDKVALIEMNPPTKLIFLTKPLIDELSDVLLELEKNDDVNVAVLTGKGDSFATGADIKALDQWTQKAMTFDDYFERAWFRVIPSFRKPLIAAINGMAFGGGLEVAMMCDILLASENAKLGQPEINLGIIPGAGGTVRLTSMVGKSKAMEMCLTGEPINAQDALKWGLVSQVFPTKDALREGALKMAKKIASKSQMAAAFAKRSVKNALEVGETSAINHERSLFIAVMGTKDKVEGTKAFIGKRKPDWKNE